MQKPVVVDCKGHLKGRLASIVAKQLLMGRHVVLVRCEALQMSGPIGRREVEFRQFIQKKTNTNPRRGPFHHKSPSMMMWRTVRGMLPHKMPRGAAALARLKLFDGCPSPYDKMKKMVVPAALKVLHLRAERKFTVLGDLASRVGWNHYDLIKKLEEKRLARAMAWYNAKKEAKKH